MTGPYRTLLIEDNPGDTRLILEMLRGTTPSTFEVETAERLADGLHWLERQDFDAILLDLGLPDSQGMETLDRLRAAAPAIPIVVMTGNDDLDLALRAVQAGAQDYLVKGQVHGNLVSRSVRYAVERKRAEAALRQSETKYRTLVEKLHEGVCALDVVGLITYANPRMAEMLGYSGAEVAEIVGRPAFDFMDAADGESARTALLSRGRGTNETCPFDFLRKDGSLIHTIAEVGPIVDDRGTHVGYLAAIRDVTTARLAEERIRQLNRMYHTISEINQLIVRERRQESVLQGACGILVEQGDFRLAWVGTADLETGLLRPVASAGATEFLDGLSFRIDDTPQGRGPQGRAYRDGVAVALAQDWTCDPSVEPWREKGLALGLRSSAAVPIIQGQRVFGILNVDAGVPNAFDGEVIGQLTELAGDLGFAIQAIEESKLREDAERATAQSEERLKGLAAATFEGIAFTEQGVLMDGNKQFAAMFGYPLDELRGKNTVDLVAPESRELVAANIRDNVLDPYEHVALRKDGTAFPIEVHAQLMSVQGRSLRVTAVRDLSERKRAEGDLRASEAKYRLLHESMMDGFARTDLQGRVLESNAVFQSMLGYTDEELRKLNVLDLTPETWHARELEVAEQCLSRGYSDVFEKEYRRKDGVTLPAEIRMFLLREVSGLPGGVWAIVRDITERRRSEDALRASERKYKQFFEQDLAGHYVSTPEGRVTACNGAFARLLGFTSVEDAVTSDLTACHSSSRARQEFLERLEASGRVDRLETERRRRDGTPLAVIESAVRVRDERSGLFEIHGFLIDDSERKTVEAAFRQAQKMEAVGRLAGGVAHDFNNVLGVIMGYSGLLLGRLAEQDPDGKKLEQIVKAAERGASLTHQLLAFSRKQVLQPRPLDLNQLVRGIEPMLRRLIGEDVQLVTALREDLGLVTADGGQLEQVLMNLAVNARDAMPSGGRLIIETAGREAHQGSVRSHPEAIPGRCLELLVRDTGCGMDAATRAHIFEPFFTTKEAGKGTGLGLATVYGVVKQSGGHIDVESEPGGGTTFRMCFPLVEAFGDHSLPRVERTSPRGGAETILVLEDDTALRAIVQETLGLAGYDVLGASCPEEGRALLHTHPEKIDLLLSDVIMPGTSGPDFAAEVAALRPEARVLYMSGYTDESVARQRILAAGAQLLQKPFTPADLLREVRATLDGLAEGPATNANREA